MGLLAGVCYDPSTAVSFSIAADAAMAAIDTTNLTVSFTAPTSGNVIVKLSGVVWGATALPPILVGIMQHTGGAVVARRVPLSGKAQSSGTYHQGFSAVIPVSGLSGTVTWDAGVAVQLPEASAAIKYGGPNDSTTDNAWGAFCFEVWDAKNILGMAWYDPAVAVSKSTSALIAQTALDTTNLRATFTAPASGNIMVQITGGAFTGATGAATMLLSALESTTVIGRTVPVLSDANQSTGLTTDIYGLDTTVTVQGVTAGSHNYDLAYGVDIVQTANLKYGGPNDASGGDAYGGLGIIVWDAT